MTPSCRRLLCRARNGKSCCTCRQQNSKCRDHDVGWRELAADNNGHAIQHSGEGIHDSPIGIAPTGGNRAYDFGEGEIAVTKAAKAGNHLQILSTQASTSIDDVNKERGGNVWFQLYASSSWDI